MGIKKIWLHSIFGTAFIFLLLGGILKISYLNVFNLFDPIGDAISDVEFTDLVFSELREVPQPDTNIVIVNIGELNRSQIAAQIEILNRYKPKVIAVDGFFAGEKDSLGDVLLTTALQKVNRLVLASQAIYNPEEEKFDSLFTSHPNFSYGQTGIANLFTDVEEQHQYKVCRSFPAFLEVNGEKMPSFALTVAEIFDSAKVAAFYEFNHDLKTIINYRGNLMDYGQTKLGTRYYGLDADQVLNESFTEDLIKNKIVLMGYTGKNFNDKSWEDKFYTPLNTKYAGRSNPDTFGVVIHANVISMILNEDYLSRQGTFSAVVTAIIICLVNVFFFSKIYWRVPLWYDGVTKIIQLAEIMLILLINIYVFHWFSYKASLTLATAAIAISGDALEVYYGFMVNVFSKRNRLSQYKRRKKGN